MTLTFETPRMRTLSDMLLYTKLQHIRSMRNIGDDAQGQGYAGTLADAVSPHSNPDLIYAGGHNNGASSGVLKSTDRGQTWIPT